MVRSSCSGVAVGLPGSFEEFGDLVLGGFDFLFHAIVAHRAVFAGVGIELGAVSRDGELADFDLNQPRDFMPNDYQLSGSSP